MGPARSHSATVPVLLLMICATSAYAKLGNNIISECAWGPMLTPPCTYVRQSVTPPSSLLAGVNETQAVAGKVGIQNQLSARYYGLVGLATYQALAAAGAPPAALAGELTGCMQSARKISPCGLMPDHLIDISTAKVFTVITCL